MLALPIEKWLQEAIFANIGVTPLRKVGRVLGVMNGVLSVATPPLLSYQFGAYFASLLNLSDPDAIRALQIFLAITAPLPILVLATKSTYLTYDEMATGVSESEKKLMKASTKLNQFYKAYFMLVGFLSGIADAALAYDQFVKYISQWALLIALPDFIASVIINARSYNTLNKTIYAIFAEKRLNNRLISGEEIDRFVLLRRDLISVVKQADSFIHSNNVDQNIALYNVIFSDTVSVNEKIFALFYAEKNLKESVSLQFDARKVAFLLLSIPFAVVSVVPMFMLGKLGSNLILEKAGVRNTVVLSIVANIVGTTAALCRGSLAIQSNADGFEKLATMVFQAPKKITALRQNGFSCDSTVLRSALSTFFILLIAACATTTRSEMIREYTDLSPFYKAVLIIMSMISAFNLRYWSISGFIHSLFSPKSPEKTALLQSTEKLSEKIEGLSESALEELGNAFLHGSRYIGYSKSNP